MNYSINIIILTCLNDVLIVGSYLLGAIEINVL